MALRKGLSHHRRWLAAALAGGLLAGCGQGGDSGGDKLPATAEAPGAVEGASAGLAIFPPGPVPPGSVLLVRGGGFDQACAVRVSLGTPDPSALGEAPVEPGGTFSLPAVVPEDAPRGEHPVLAEALTRASPDGPCDVPGAAEPLGELTVAGNLPLLTLDRLEGRPGGPVSVTGRGFCAAPACSAVSLWMDGTLSAADVVVGADGTFSVDAQVPAVEAAGAIVVVAVQTDAAGDELRAFGDISLTVRPNVPRPQAPD